ncbi:MAG: PF20097 family protein [Gemmatimonadaceae bacterium]
MTAAKCPKCGGTMIDGFIVDHTYGANVQSEWAEGEPKKSFWTGLKMKGVPLHSVTTLRCERCGYLESFARE